MTPETTIKKSQFTPGPWEAGMYKMQPTVFWARGNGTVPIASVHDIASTGDPRANARLIAAAPALYEALREVRRAYNQGPDARSIRIAMDSAIDHVDAALSLVDTNTTEERK